MRVNSGRKTFLDSDAAKVMRVELESMIQDPSFNTGLREIDEAFVEKHMNYISRYPYIDPRQYINNLKMKSRV